MFYVFIEIFKTVVLPSIDVLSLSLLTISNFSSMKIFITVKAMPIFIFYCVKTLTFAHTLSPASTRQAKQVPSCLFRRYYAGNAVNYDVSQCNFMLSQRKKEKRMLHAPQLTKPTE